ncbi:MAG: recombination regulator RecX [Spirochaetaceae bacterium]|nr:recombination regulator RecX [Spirochaetaceae bacterium]
MNDESDIPVEKTEAFVSALKLVSRAEQCGAMLTRKLRQRGYSGKDAAAAIEKLEENGLLDDSRFARLWLQSRIARKTENPRKLAAGLLAKGINERIVRAALKETLPTETEFTLLTRYINETGISERAALRACGFSAESLEML